MQSKATTVDDYLAEATPERRAALQRLRSACLASLPEASESMIWGMACYTRIGRVEIAFANQKQYLALYLLKVGVVAANKAALKGLSVGKSCIRFRDPGKIDFALVERLLAESRDSQEVPC